MSLSLCVDECMMAVQILPAPALLAEVWTLVRASMSDSLPMVLIMSWGMRMAVPVPLCWELFAGLYEAIHRKPARAAVP